MTDKNAPVPQGRPKRDPLLGAAIVKMRILTNRNGQASLLQPVYEGLLEDLSLTDDQVDAYMKDNWEKVRQLTLS